MKDSERTILILPMILKTWLMWKKFPVKCNFPKLIQEGIKNDEISHLKFSSTGDP